MHRDGAEAKGREWIFAVGVAIVTFLPFIFPATMLASGSPVGEVEASADDVGESPERQLYLQHCASCHGSRRYGGYAPPLIPETLARKGDPELARAILEGLPNTQMPPFEDVLETSRVRELVAFLREPPGEIRWSAEQIAASRVEPKPLRRAIPADVRRENLILVVERGTSSVVVLDGDRMRELDRFPVGRIHGGIKFDRALHRALAVSRDGTLVQYDLDGGFLRVKVKVGVNTRNLAVSPDGDFVAVANQLPAALVLLDGDLQPLAVYPLEGQPSAVYQLPGRNSFAVGLRDVARLVVVQYGPTTRATAIPLPEPFEDFVFVPGSTRLVASSRGGRKLILYDFAEHEVVATLPTEGLPHLFSAAFFVREGRLYAAFNHMGAPRLSLIDMQAFEVVEEIPLLGSGYFARTHPASPYIWVDTNSEAIQLIAKDSLSLLDRVLVPAPGKKAMHVEFTESGDRALVSVWHNDGAVVVYDSVSLAETRRLPFAMPVGKYNAANKTRIPH